MSHQLSQADQEQYRRDGFFFPLRILSAAEAADHREQLENMEAKHGLMHYRTKPYLLMKSAAEIGKNPLLLDAVESLLGPDILLWDGAYVIKEPSNKKYISWHQDLTYWGLDGDELVTAWVALSEVTTENGCMKILPRSHHQGKHDHHSTFDEENILHRGQELNLEIDEEQVVSVELQSGEVSLHHGWTPHASYPNTSGNRRIGLSLQYLTPRMRQTHTDRELATLGTGRRSFQSFQYGTTLYGKFCSGNDYFPS